MNQKVRVAQYGIGKMAVYMMRYMMEQGEEVLGVVDINPDVVGKDIGETLEKETLGVVVTDAKDIEEKRNGGFTKRLFLEKVISKQDTSKRVK